MPAHARFATLTLCMSLLTSPVYALEAISDAELGESTGEGIALLPEDFSLVMKDEDASYINIIPRGAPKTAGVNRADIYIRNLAITSNVGAAANDNNTRASNVNVRSWGSGANPFLLSVLSDDQPDYTSGSANRSFLRLELPQYCFTGVATGAGTGCIAGADTGEALDAYNLRLGASVDLLIKNNGDKQGYIDGSGTAITSNNLDSAKGIGLQAIWNGLSLNGTRIDLFQTPSGSTDSSSYDGTFGMRVLLRLNTDASKVNNGLRLSTALASSNAGERLFNANEGITISDLDINLPLGIPHYQSLVLGKADASGNFYMELTRLPNNSAAYDEAYINYSNEAEITAKTCTSTSCGTTGANGVPATHGTISMGNVSFKDRAGTSVNLGSAKIDGLLIQHLKLTTTGL